MNHIIQTVLGILLACGVLIILWLTQRDRFAVDLPALATKSGCIQAVTDSESRVLEEFEDQALLSISGGNIASELPAVTEPEKWKPSLASLRILLDTNAIVDMAMSRLRSAIAKNQQDDPHSIMNTQKGYISELFVKGRAWCEKLPGKETSK